MSKKTDDFLPLLKPYKKEILLAFFSILVTNLLGLAFPWGIKIVVDDILIRKDAFLLNITVLSLIVIFSLRFFLGYLREYLVCRVGEKVVRDLRLRLYLHLHRLSVSYVENTPAGSVISRIIGDTESVRKFLFGGMIDFLYSFLNIFFVLIILFILDWRLTLVSLLFFPFFAGFFMKSAPRLKAKHGFLREKYDQLTARLNEVLSGIRVVSGLAKEEYESRGFAFRQEEILEASLASHRMGILLWTASELLSSLGLAVIIWAGAKAVFSGRVSTGTLMAFYSYLGMLFSPVIKMVIINNYYQEARASLERINRMLLTEPAIREMKHPVVLSGLKGNVCFRDVSFAYDNGKAVLSDINLEVRPDETVALVGKSGAGKTTLINLILRFYDPVRGGVFIDGRNLKTLQLASYRRRLAMVLQDDYLFSSTIRENILYARPDAGEKQMIRAAQLANAHQFISLLAQGYDTPIGERGIKLSYGQRQRISIARAIVGEPNLLILDEATSCVDSETERRIIEDAFKNLARGRTTFIIAHRLSSVTYADKIVFIDRGMIVEEGSHAELLDKKGYYRRMWEEQNRDAVLRYDDALQEAD